jgi:hypothetical protein
MREDFFPSISEEGHVYKTKGVGCLSLKTGDIKRMTSCLTKRRILTLTTEINR